MRLNALYECIDNIYSDDGDRLRVYSGSELRVLLRCGVEFWVVDVGRVWKRPCNCCHIHIGGVNGGQEKGLIKRVGVVVARRTLTPSAVVQTNYPLPRSLADLPL